MLEAALADKNQAEEKIAANQKKETSMVCLEQAVWQWMTICPFIITW